VSRGGAERRRTSAQGEPSTTSTRVTAPRPAASATRKVNWWAVVLIVLVLVGLIGGFFVSLATGTDPTSTDPTSTVPTVAPAGG
jgi:hypothetical protein